MSIWFKVQDGDVSAYCWVYRVNVMSAPTPRID